MAVWNKAEKDVAEEVLAIDLIEDVNIEDEEVQEEVE